MSACPTLLLVAIDSPAYPILFSSNASLKLFFMDLVTTTQKLRGTWSTNKILCCTTNASSTSPYVRLYNMTTGDFHGNATPHYKSPRDPPAITQPLSPRCPQMHRLPTSIALLIPWEYCQPALGSQWSADYPVQPNNLKLGMWRLTSTDASHLIPHVLRDPLPSQSDPIMGNWYLCVPSNCLDLCSLMLLKVGPTSIESIPIMDAYKKEYSIHDTNIRLARRPPQSVSGALLLSGNKWISSIALMRNVP